MARDNEAQPKSVRGIVPLELICAIDVVDGKGNKIPSLILVRAKGSPDSLFTLLPEGSEKNMHPPAKWLTEALKPMLERLDKSRGLITAESKPASPDDMNVPVPPGSPEV